MRGGRSLLAALLMLLSSATAFAQPGLSGWAAVVVAGDDQAGGGTGATEAFDNARRDVAAALVSRGFAAGNIEQFSLHPDRYPGDGARPTRLDLVADALTRLAQTAPDGCLVYMTSHGTPQGVVLDHQIVPPDTVASMVSAACGDRPTAVIISACFSGVFVPMLSAAEPDHLVLTAARRDRSSFGCGAADRYPAFDACVLESLPSSRDFVDLADRTRRCVDEREETMGYGPPSNPQLSVSPDFPLTAPAFLPPPATRKPEAHARR